MSELIEYYRQLIVEPTAPGSFLDYVKAVAALLVPALIAAGLVTKVVARFARSAWEDTSTAMRVRMAWSWGVLAAAFLLLVDVILLRILQARLAGIEPVIPHYIVGLLAVLFAVVQWIRMRGVVEKMRTILQKARK